MEGPAPRQASRPGMSGPLPCALGMLAQPLRASPPRGAPTCRRGHCGHALSENQRTWAPGGNGVHLSRGMASSPEARGPAVAHVEGMAPGVRQELPLSPHRPNILTHRGHCRYHHYCIMSRNLSRERKSHVRRRRGTRDWLHPEKHGARTRPSKGALVSVASRGRSGQGLPTAVGSEQTRLTQICLQADLLLLKCEGNPGVGEADEKRERSEASDVR